mgnify:CR=1 FL=1
MVTGLNPVTLLPYRATLNGPGRAVDVPGSLADRIPSGLDPAGVYEWLHENTDVVGVNGPELAPTMRGDVLEG